jgi:hypothetical protein
MPRSDRIYVVVEGPSDAAILRRLLPRRLTERCDFVQGGGGRTAAVSTARTLLTLSREPVAIVIDADTDDQSRVQTERQTIAELLEGAVTGTRYRLFLAIPNLETIASQGQPVNQIPLVQQLVDFIESSVIPLLNVSRGQTINFTANGTPVTGTVVGSEQTTGFWASVIVETDTRIPEGAQLLMPDLPETGGCGAAHPERHGDRFRVVLSIGYSYIDFSTIGR